MKKVILCIFVFCMIVSGCSNTNNSEKEVDMMKDSTVAVSKVKEISDNYKEEDKIRIIDVRTQEEFAEGHIKNAINIPLDEISDVSFNKDLELIVYCRSGARSAQAASILKDLGYTVKDMGGLNNWNYDLEK